MSVGVLCYRFHGNQVQNELPDYTVTAFLSLGLFMSIIPLSFASIYFSVPFFFHVSVHPYLHLCTLS
jgi:hypothetical protein